MFFYGDRLNMTGSEDKTTTPAWEFYDLQSDPRENHNAYNDPQYAKIIQANEGGDAEAAERC